jgi:hypothetical protein
MTIKYTPHFLNKLEEILEESGYLLRYEKGSFTSGFCLVKDTRMAIINKYFTVEGKINCLVEIIRGIPLDAQALSEKNRKLYQEIRDEPVTGI